MAVTRKEFLKQAKDLACKVVHQRYADLFLFIFHREAALTHTHDYEFRLAYISTVVHEILLELQKHPKGVAYIELSTRAGADTCDGMVKMPSLDSTLSEKNLRGTLTVHMCDCHRSHHWGHIVIEE